MTQPLTGSCASNVEAKISVHAGDQFGRLHAISEADPYMWRGRFSRRQWLCECVCGRQSIVREDVLKFGRVLSCGCLRDEVTRERLTRHGCRASRTKTPEYEAWQAAIHSESDIPVCETWRAPKGAGFLAFLRDVGPRPSSKHRLLRLDKLKPLQRFNAAWRDDVPRPVKPRRLVSVDGSLATLRDAAHQAGIRYDLLCKRLSRGWSLSRALQATQAPGTPAAG